MVRRRIQKIYSGRRITGAKVNGRFYTSGSILNKKGRTGKPITISGKKYYK